MRLVFFAAVAFGLLASCGYPGPPQPPALNLPQPVNNLSAVQMGDKIVVRFTTPTRTTEDLPVTKLEAIDLAIAPNADFTSARHFQISASDLGPREFTIDAADWEGQQVFVAIRTTGSSGRESDRSNLDFLRVGAPLLKPMAVIPTNTRDGVALRWMGNAPVYRILRSVLSDPMPVYEPAGESDKPEFTDTATTYGVRYAYVVIGKDGDSRESLPSDPIEITTEDKFAPSVPSGLRAVSAGTGVDLSWTPSSDDDLGGYNLFRAIDDGSFEPYAQKLALPSFHDARVESGKRYRYMVSAIDMNGNESERSEEASATVE